MSDEKKTKKVERTLEQQAILDNIIACLKYKKLTKKTYANILVSQATIGRKSEPDHHSGDGFRSNQKALLTMTVGSAFLHASPEKP